MSFMGLSTCYNKDIKDIKDGKTTLKKILQKNVDKPKTLIYNKIQKKNKCSFGRRNL